MLKTYTSFTTIIETNMIAFYKNGGSPNDYIVFKSPDISKHYIELKKHSGFFDECNEYRNLDYYLGLCFEQIIKDNYTLYYQHQEEIDKIVYNFENGHSKTLTKLINRIMTNKNKGYLNLQVMALLELKQELSKFYFSIIR